MNSSVKVTRITSPSQLTELSNEWIIVKPEGADNNWKKITIITNVVCGKIITKWVVYRNKLAIMQTEQLPKAVERYNSLTEDEAAMYRTGD